ncbi:hypothetical protein KAI87_05885, partial [Myxococcota bacterium]|nr:hypothetical protein [Myxococcota bacterium]
MMISSKVVQRIKTCQSKSCLSKSNLSKSRFLMMGLLLPLALPMGVLSLSDKPAPPHTPKNFPECVSPMQLTGDLPRHLGEKLSYDVEIVDLHAGSVDLNTKRQARVKGESVTEYEVRGHVRRAINMMVTMEVSASSLVGEKSRLPVAASSSYRLAHRHSDEQQRFNSSATRVASNRKSNKGTKKS